MKIYLATLEWMLTPLISRKTNPSYITSFGLLLSAIAGVLLWLGHLVWGGIFLFLSGVCDNMDGILARATGRSTSFGALFDSTLDRYGEFFIYIGLFGYIASTPDIHLVRVFQLVVVVALMGSVMVSYVRARSEAVGLPTSVGLFQRPARIVLLGFAALLSGATNFAFDRIAYAHLHDFFIRLFLLILAVGTHITAFRRLADARKTFRKVMLK